jgi:DNA-binding HxlR family transcriptional regulator
MRSRSDDTRTRCPVEATLGVIGGRWKGVVLFHLASGTKRFGELRRLLPNVTQRMLTLQLRELEEDGLVRRTVYAVVPPRVEYDLTVWGRSLEPILREMRDWGDRYKRRLVELRPGESRSVPQRFPPR